jgi:tetratricopeptide (TPR) repeat protein
VSAPGTSTGPRPAVGRLDPDELAALEEERDHLLGSLDDLEREHDAGDLDDVDYDALKDDYTARAAEVIRAIDEHRSLVRTARRPMPRGRVAAISAAVLLVAVVAGVLVARSAGQRGGGTLTGNDGGLRAQLATCQPLAFRSPAKGVACYQKILDATPDNIDALTYQGWALVLDGRVDRGAANLARAVKLDPKYPDARVFRAIVLARAGESAARSGNAATARESFTAAAAELDTFYRNDPPEVAVQVLQQEGLERKIFFGLLDAATLACWQQTAAASPTNQPIDQAFLDTLGRCLDGALATSPASADALLSKALTLIGPDRQDVAAARALVERILAADPRNANALLLRTSLALSQGRFDDAERDLAALDALPRPTGSFLIGSPEQLRDALKAGRAAATSTTTTTAAPTSGASVSTVPGAPSIPNASGG